MRAARADRLWLVGGALTAAALFAAAWFLFIGPQRAQTGELNGQASVAEVQLTSLQHRLVELREQNTRLPQYRAQLARDRQALPTAAELASFLRQLQTGGDQVGVTVDSVLVGSPLTTSAGSRQVYALPVTLTAAGTATQVRSFIDQLQEELPRAVLIGGATAAPEEGSLTLGARINLTLSVRLFVATVDGADAATKPN
jgi:Tfp pilus assembly protein PilO